ncbi:MAG: type II secretion system protein [bacterium]|nr:type II secretion system protein [bacterium]
MNYQKKHALAPARKQQAGRGFTMIELLVVMLVITMLLVIAVPAIMTFRNQSKINATQAIINMVDGAVGMYYSHHKTYPNTGELAIKLIGLEDDDFHPGPGYRIQERGEVYGPWNGVDEIKHGDKNFIDIFGNTIWYCKFNNNYSDSTFEYTKTEDNVTLAGIRDYATDASGKFYRRDYILMSPSADSKWGLPRNDGSSGNPLTDDVTNFFR